MTSPTTLFTDPREFFEDREIDMKIPIAIIGAIVLLRLVRAVVDALLLTPQLARAMGAPEAGFFGALGGLIGGVITAVLGPVLALILFTAIFYGMSELLADDPTGDFTDVLAITAWGLIPRLITIVVALLLSIVAVVLVGPVGVSAAVANLLLLIAPAVGLVMTLLSAYIWGNGLAVVRNITPKQGYISVAPVVILGLLVTLLSIAFGLISVLLS